MIASSVLAVASVLLGAPVWPVVSGLFLAALFRCGVAIHRANRRLDTILAEELS